jgi:hypothetical protein
METCEYKVIKDPAIQGPIKTNNLQRLNPLNKKGFIKAPLHLIRRDLLRLHST